MSPVRMSKFEAPMRLVLDFNKAFNRRDLAGMMELVSDDCVFESAHPAPDGKLYRGKEEIAGYWRDYFNEKCQAQREIEEIFSAGERCILRWKSTWMSTGNQKETLRGVDLFQSRDGLLDQILSYVKE